MKHILLTIVLISTFAFSQTTAGGYKVENLGSNSKNSDFGTTFYGENKIIFSSSRQEGSSLLKAKWKENKQPFLDLYIGTINKDGTVTDVERFSTNVNTKFHESSVSFTPDQKTVYFTRNNFLDKKLGKDDDGITNLAIYKASVTSDNSWVDIKSMPFNNENYSCGHPSISNDGKKLYFTSDMPGTYGETDIFVVDILDETYGIPRNLGRKINTLGKEVFPFIDQENVLYFSSDGRENGMGGLDVYAAKIYEKSVSNALHLGAPVNSESDDFGYILKTDIHEGYFSSNRKNGVGDDDIYHFTAYPPLKIECNQNLTGIVKDKETGKIITNAVVVLFDDKDKELDSKTTDDKGIFNFNIDCNASFKIVGTKENYKKDIKSFSSENNPDTKVRLDLNLEPIPEVIVTTQKKVVVNINPIYFDFDKYFIRKDAKIELDKVIAIMQKYPNLIIEGGSHTDVRGEDTYNLDLSSRRANSTVNYIIKYGIDASRITAKGFGETQLLNHCSNGVVCNEESHQQNRRTEFVILNPDVLGYETITE
ncbi:MAG: OmpA family protein [Flavobacteriaceae bacterium]|nr:OmpA family protein [Flavobacteriaceae bacterium]